MVGIVGSAAVLGLIVLQGGIYIVQAGDTKVMHNKIINNVSGLNLDVEEVRILNEE